MGLIRGVVDDAIEEEFRELAREIYGKKYNIKYIGKALEDAISLWIKVKKGVVTIHSSYEENEKEKARQFQETPLEDADRKSDRRCNKVEAFLGLSPECVVVVKDVELRFGYGKISIPFRDVEDILNTEEFKKVLDSYDLYWVLHVIDDDNYISFIPKFFDEFININQKRAKLKEWLMKNLKPFVRDLMLLIKRSEKSTGEVNS